MSGPRIASLHLYPVKSCAGVEVQRMALDERGPVDDREWLVVDELGSFVTQREEPRLALVRVDPGAETLRLDAPGAPSLTIPRDVAGAPREVLCWGDRAPALDCGDEVAAWLSARMGSSLRLVRMAPVASRQVDPRWSPAPALTRFTDGFPLLLVSQASLDALNARLDAPLPMDRFRPNLVLAGCEPHEEDTWRRIRVGSLELAPCKPCSRCIVTTTDQATAERGAEPLRTLASYRTLERRAPDGRRDTRIAFGVNAVALGTGVLESGAEIEVLERAS